MKLSVIITTLGGIELKDTVTSLQNNSIRPMEILICIPNSSELLPDIDLSDNVEIIVAKKKGQVYQRMIGFLAAKGELVLQIDDDVTLEKDAIKMMVNFLNSLDKNAAIAPLIFKKGTDQSVFMGNRSTFASRVSDWVMNGISGYKPGIISLSGVGFGINFNDKLQHKTEFEWLPGGCILHRSKNLITQDYFPFSGKAYSEDLMHSLLLRENGIKLYVCNNAIAYTEVIDYQDSLIELFHQYQASKHVIKLQGKGFVRLHLFYFLRLIKIILRVARKVIFSFIKKPFKLKK